MNAIALAKTAYNTTSRAPLRTHRGTEYEAFAKVTHKIGKSSKDNFAQLAAALHENRQLWTLLAADIASDGNELPTELRARLFYLAEFTTDYSRKILSDGADPEVLVEINTAVMRGLRQSEGAS